MTSRTNDPEHWRARADEARAVAEMMSNEETRMSMLKIAEGYEHLAERAEVQAKYVTTAGMKRATG